MHSLLQRSRWRQPAAAGHSSASCDLSAEAFDLSACPSRVQVFYLLWSNCLIGFAFLLSTLFTSTRTALVTAFLLTFASGLFGFLVLQSFIRSERWWIIFLELVPGFGLYRGLYEIAQYAFKASWQGGDGFTWSLVSSTGVNWVMIIFAAEFVIFMTLAWYLEQASRYQQEAAAAARVVVCVPSVCAITLSCVCASTSVTRGHASRLGQQRVLTLATHTEPKS
jgi:hypothetical protein